jgi:iron complex outermembrane receptor protein
MALDCQDKKRGMAAAPSPGPCPSWMQQEGSALGRANTAGWNGMRRGALGMALFLTTAIVPVEMAWGQAVPNAAVATYAFAVPQGPLGEALIAYGQQAGRQITYRPAMAQGLRSNGVSGTMSPEAALARLLAGTGLTYRMVDGRTVTLEPAPRAPQEGAVVLPEVSVTASTQRGFSPVQGYVAEVSATGSKTDTPILEIPQSISVVTREEIEDRAAQSLVQAAGYMPSVRTPYGEDGRNDFFFLRGFFAGNFLDGLRFPTPTGFYGAPRIEPYGLERFEVLRGPSSVLYGQSAPGGIVNSISKRPTEEPLHEVRLQAGSHDRIQGAFDLSGPIDEDREWLYRIVGLARDSRTQIDYSPDDRIFLAPSLTWRPTSQTSITLLTQFQRDNSGIAAARLPARGRVLPNVNGHISNRLFVGEPDFNLFERTQAVLGYALEHRFSDDWAFRQNLRYARSELERKEVILSHPAGQPALC